MKIICFIVSFVTAIFCQQIKIEETKSIGLDDDFIFVELHQILFHKNNIFLSDRAGFTFYKFSNDLKLLGSVGNKGRGPSEFVTGPSYLGSVKDTILVFDSNGNRKVHYYNADLKYIKTRNLIDMPRAAIIRDNYKICSLYEFDTEQMLTFFSTDFQRKNSIKVKNLDEFTPLNLFKIQADKNNNLVVQYQFRNLVQIYSPKGKMISEFSIDEIRHKPEFEKIERGKMTPFKKRNPKTASIFSNIPINGSTIYRAVPDNKRRIFVQGGRYEDEIWKTVFITDYKGKLLGKVYLTLNEILAGFDEQNNLYTFAEERTVLKKYKVLD